MEMIQQGLKQITSEDLDSHMKTEKSEPEISDTQGTSVQNLWLPTSISNMGRTQNSEANDLSVSVSDQGQPELTASLLVRPMSDLTERSKACRMVEAATNMWRYSPYEREHSERLLANSPGISAYSEKSFIKSNRMSPKLGEPSVSIGSAMAVHF